MELLRQAVTMEVWVFTLGLAAIVGMQILTGEINTANLLYGRRKGASGLELYFSPERVQLLIFTLGVAWNYVLSLAQDPSACRLPEVPQQTLAILGGSHAIYLGGKAYSMLLRNSRGASSTNKERS